jgi:hypothetical protein
MMPRWWRAYQLTENDQVDELRRLADAGDDDAELWLARWLTATALTSASPDKKPLNLRT